MPFDVITSDPVDRTIRDAPQVISTDYTMVTVYITRSGRPWSSLRLAQAWAQDNGGGPIVHTTGFLHDPTGNVFSWHENPLGSHYVLGTEYQPRESEERIRQRALAKLDADELRALGLADPLPRAEPPADDPDPPEDIEPTIEPTIGPTMWEHLDEESV